MTLQGDEQELALGATGEQVEQLQDRLRAFGLFTERPDGTFGDSTEQALRDVQLQLGLEPHGRMDERTWQVMDQYMMERGLEYNPYAGPANQLWDQPGFGEVAEDPWAQGAWDDQAAEQAPEQPVIPHPDHVHPAIAGDERFSSFNEFLREHHGV